MSRSEAFHLPKRRRAPLFCDPPDDILEEHSTFEGPSFVAGAYRDYKVKQTTLLHGSCRICTFRRLPWPSPDTIPTRLRKSFSLRLNEAKKAISLVGYRLAGSRRRS